MSDASDTAKPKLSLGLRIVFGLSLALNLLVVGALVGAILRPGPLLRDMEPRVTLGRVLYKELPREERRALRREVRQNVGRDTLRQASVAPQLYAALRADPFDPDAVRQLMDRQAQALQVGQSAMRDGWLTVLSRMTLEERVAYADRLRDAARDKPRPPKE